MNIRRAMERDIPAILELLRQVNAIHHKGRPDIFKLGTKYSETELRDLLPEKSRPIFVATDDGGTVLGYAFCIFEQHAHSRMLTDIKTLYIDDICVDAGHRGQHVGSALYRHAIDFARKNGCYNVTLNVWALNPVAQRFYESLGMKPLKTGMEAIL